MKFIVHNGLTRGSKICSGIFDICDLRSDMEHDLSIANTWEKRILVEKWLSFCRYGFEYLLILQIVVS